MLRIKNNFDLKSTITCGQIFRYEIIDNKYIVILKDRVISLEIDNDYIIVKSNKSDNLKEVIYEYFDLNRDYNVIINELKEKNKDIKYNEGLRIINGNPYEVIISYIISQNNRVPSIKKSLDLISKYGEEVIFEGKKYNLFPSIDVLKTLKIEDIRNFKVGFRDKYLYYIINSDFDYNKIYNMDTKEALKYLMSYKGIGIKVASCILLFSYKRLDVFPIDTWVKKYMKDEYNIEGIKNIEKFSYENYGMYSGLVLQYMFDYKRNGGK